MKEPIINIENKKVGEIDLNDAIFCEKPNKALIYEVIRMQMANRREGNAASCNHKMVSGTTAKMYRQKGTGRARHGDARTNIFVGGGKAFGPHPRDYGYRIPAKARKGGLRSALAVKKVEGKLIVVDAFPLKAIKTKDVVAVLRKMNVQNGLIVIEEHNEKLEKSARNIPNIKTITWDGLNAYDLIRHEHAIITRAALDKVQEVLQP